MKGFKVLGGIFLVILMVFLFMMGCEKNTIEPVQSIQKIEKVEKVSEQLPEMVDGMMARKLLPPESFTTTLKWHWRRIQVDGDMRTMGSKNINGDPGTVREDNVDALNASFELTWPNPYSWQPKY